MHSVAFSPDGRTLATSTFDNIARLWDVATGEQIAALRGGGQSGVHPVAFSPDGRTLATSADDNTARLWPVAQGLIDFACARVHDLPLPEEDKRRFGIQNEWCTRKVSEDLRTQFGIHDRSANSSAAAPAR